MMRKSLVVVAVSAALTVAAFAASSNSQKSTITGGDFAVMGTRVIGQPATDKSAAVQSLRNLGVTIGDANAGLTEGMAAKILADLGLHVSTSSPGSGVTTGKADQLATMIGLASAGIVPAQELPKECLNSRNRGTCQEGCKNLFGCAPSPALCAFSSGGPECCKHVNPGP